MEDRKRRFDDKNEVRGKIAGALKHGAGNATSFDGIHIFTPHGEVPDDSALRLVVVPPDKWYSREEPRLAVEAALECMRNTARSRGIAGIDCYSSLQTPVRCPDSMMPPALRWHGAPSWTT
jgi:predicted AAA+ superfamily ATPase